jgi:hypothetical protein
MSNYILVKVDMNDGDYASKFTAISDETLAIIMPLIQKIKSNSSYHNFNYRENCDDGEHAYDVYVDKETVDHDEEVLDIFWDFLPVTEYGFHTIETIEIYDVGHVEKLL